MNDKDISRFFKNFDSKSLDDFKNFFENKKSKYILITDSLKSDFSEKTTSETTETAWCQQPYTIDQLISLFQNLYYHEKLDKEEDCYDHFFNDLFIKIKTGYLNFISEKINFLLNDQPAEKFSNIKYSPQNDIIYSPYTLEYNNYNKKYEFSNLNQCYIGYKLENFISTQKNNANLFFKINDISLTCNQYGNPTLYNFFISYDIDFNFNDINKCIKYERYAY